ncbi:hypothetical protein ACIGHN_03735 [Acidovorax sp. NPDC077693]|uniref:hypothetical protein n=1 Tax=unclassified Acidovorax TaxID=2684926 RepID=UPI0037C7E7E4
MKIPELIATTEAVRAPELVFTPIATGMLLRARSVRLLTPSSSAVYTGLYVHFGTASTRTIDIAIFY